MLLADATARPKLRFSGRSFLAFVLEPSVPVSAWLADLDESARRSQGFFAERPVILDLSVLSLNKAQTAAILQAVTSRGIRVIAVEGVDPAFLPPALVPFAGGMNSRRSVDSLCVDQTEGHTSSLVLEDPVRSGQSVFFPQGDVTILGAISSGAEVIAGGSIHVYGPLRGRAIAGSTGSTTARIFCRKFQAELVAIDGRYLTAEECGSEFTGKPVQVRLDNDAIKLSLLER